jgi:hypothetical protein
LKNTVLIHKIGNYIAAGLMIFFSIPKLIGAEKSRKGFEQFKSLVPLDPDVFRLVTGIIELYIAILLIIYAIKNINNLGKLAYFLLLSTMIGGLIMEFFARPTPDMMLVIIAVLLTALSLYRLKTLFN